MSYANGQKLTKDKHFQDHIDAQVPIQVYDKQIHQDIGMVQSFCKQFVQVNQVLYNRRRFQFISRPGY